MAKLNFDAAALKPLVAHALACTAHSPTYAMLTDPAYLKEGVTLAADDWAKAEDIEYSKVPAHLQLVKDEGVYLMSSGRPRLMDPADPSGKKSLVVYAEGMSPDDGWEAWQLLGGDDFVETIDIAFVKKAVDSAATRLIVNITSKSISLSFDRPRVPPTSARKRLEGKL